MAFKSGIRRLGSVTCSVLSLFPYLCVCLGVGVGGGLRCNSRGCNIAAVIQEVQDWWNYVEVCLTVFLHTLHRLSSRWKNGKAYFIAASQLIAAPCIAATLLVSDKETFYWLLLLAYITAETWLGPAAAIAQVGLVFRRILAHSQMLFVSFLLSPSSLLSSPPLPLHSLIPLPCSSIDALQIGYQPTSYASPGVSRLHWFDHHRC